jgi:Rad3-related DNA helicase
MIDDLQRYFPMPEFRPGQLEILSKALTAFEKGHKFFVAEAPVGIGKSAVGFAAMQHFGSGYYITTQKILQDQLVNDFGETGKWRPEHLDPLIELKGRTAYECLYGQFSEDLSHRWKRQVRGVQRVLSLPSAKRKSTASADDAARRICADKAARDKTPRLQGVVDRNFFFSSAWPYCSPSDRLGHYVRC